MKNFIHTAQYFWAVHRTAVYRTRIGEIRKKKSRTLKDCDMESQLIKKMTICQQRVEEIEDKIF